MISCSFLCQYIIQVSYILWFGLNETVSLVAGMVCSNVVPVRFYNILHGLQAKCRKTTFSTKVTCSHFLALRGTCTKGINKCKYIGISCSSLWDISHLNRKTETCCYPLSLSLCVLEYRLYILCTLLFGMCLLYRMKKIVLFEITQPFPVRLIVSK